MTTHYYLKTPVRIGAPGVQPSPLLPEDAIELGLDCNIILIPAGTEITSYREETNGICIKVRIPGLVDPRMVLIGWLFLSVRVEGSKDD